ncbi:MAG: caspase family protein [Pseudomonadota bacterium]
MINVIRNRLTAWKIAQDDQRMQGCRQKLTIIVSVLFIITPLLPHAAAEQRIALVIGNAAYTNEPLDNPVNDALAVSTMLTDFGFDVHTVIDGNLKAMQQGLLGFTEAMTPGATAVVFYAGHGVQANDRNYLMPVDANISSESELRFSALEMNDVLDELSRARARISIVIMDACRNNPFEQKTRGGSRGLAVVDAAAGTLIAYATSPGSVAADGNGTNGVYTTALLEALTQPGLQVEEVFKRVRREVVRVTSNRQIPWESSSLTGDFVFNERAVSKGATDEAQNNIQSSEDVFWLSIRDSKDSRDFEAYLSQFPEGIYRSLAQTKVDVLTASPPVQDCADLTGTYLISTEDTACEDSLVLTPMDDGRYQGAYTTCHAIELVANIRGIVTIDDNEPNVLNYRWNSPPCNGTTVYSLDQTCTTGSGRITRTGGVPGLCNIFANKRAELRVRRANSDQPE